MPIYEFRCDTCGTDFEELVRSSQTISEVACPACRSRKVRKQISLVASRSSSRPPTAPSSAACATGT